MAIVVGPRANSMWMSGGASVAGGADICTATKAGRSLTVVACTAKPWLLSATAPPRSASTTQRLSMLPFKPLANATAAIDTPDFRHACTTLTLKSALWRLCVRRPGASTTTEVSMCPR